MKELKFDFCFKGKRKYVHGTDVFSALSTNFNGQLKYIDISFHGIAIRNLIFFTEKPKKKDIKVVFKAESNGEKIKLFGVEDNKDIECRYDYAEEKIIDQTTIDLSNEIISLNQLTDYSFIEHIVAMNKALLNNLYIEKDGQWLFTRLQLTNNIQMNEIESLDIALKLNVQFKLTKSVINVNNREMGYLYFSFSPKVN